MIFLVIFLFCYLVWKFVFVCGKIIFFGFCVGNVFRFMFRNLFVVINIVLIWNFYVCFLFEVLVELVFWKFNVVSFNGIFIWFVRYKFLKIVYFDVFGLVCGSFIEFEGKMFY